MVPAAASTDVVGGCPHDCPDTCAWVATVEDGVVTRVRGARGHPVTAGHLCVKVKDYQERLYHPDRLLQPQVRTGPKGSGRFSVVSWDEALDEVAAGLEAAVDRLGGAAVLPYRYMGTQGVLQGASMDRRFFNRLGASDLEGTICYATGGWAYGITYPGWPETDIEDVPHAEVAVAWGANMFSTHLHMWPFMQAVRKHGGTLVCVDPVRTKTARAADVHLQLRPGSDAALALAVVHVVFAEGLEDAEFLAERCVGGNELRDRALEWTPARASVATGLAEDEIVAFARLWANAKPGFVKTGPGAQRHADAGQAFRAILALPAVTGAWRHRGGGVHVHSASNFSQGTPSFVGDDLRPPGLRRSVNMVELGRALAGDLDGPPVEAVVVYDSNPAVIAPDSAAVRAGLGRDDLFSVVIDQFLTETAAYADVVLPATTQLEHLDVMWSWGHRYLTLNRPAVAPQGEALPNTEIFRRLAARMGFADSAFADGDEDLLAQYLSDYPDGVRASLRERGWAKVTPPPRADTARVMLRLDDGLAAGLGLDPLPQARDHDADPTTLALVTPKSHHFLNSSFVNHERLRRAAGSPLVHLSPADAAARGIADRDLVQLSNGARSIAVDATVSDDVAPGTAMLYSNWWHADLPGGSGANLLTEQDPNDLGGGPVFAARVQVRPAAGHGSAASSG